MNISDKKKLKKRQSAGTSNGIRLEMSDSECDVEDRKEVERILKLEPDSRSTRDINLLQRFFEDNLYF